MFDSHSFLWPHIKCVVCYHTAFGGYKCSKMHKHGYNIIFFFQFLPLFYSFFCVCFVYLKVILYSIFFPFETLQMRFILGFFFIITYRVLLLRNFYYITFSSMVGSRSVSTAMEIIYIDNNNKKKEKKRRNTENSLHLKGRKDK